MHNLDEIPLQWATVTFHLQAREDVEFDKFPGFILRSGFGFALKRLCRFQGSRAVCAACQFRDACPYSFIFETPKTEATAADFTAENFPHPFVMAPPAARPYTVPAGQPFSVNFTLFGDGIPYLLFYIYAFDVLGEHGLGRSRGKFVLDRVTDAVTGAELFSHTDKRLKADPEIQHGAAPAAMDGTPVTLEFQTPAKILKNNRSIAKLETDGLIRSLLRRVSLLCRLHQKQEWELDYRTVIDNFNREVKIVDNQTQSVALKRHSSRQRQSHPLFAFTGSAVLSGHLTPYARLLQMGAVTHIGNSTSQGLGKYQMN